MNQKPNFNFKIYHQIILKHRNLLLKKKRWTRVWNPPWSLIISVTMNTFCCWHRSLLRTSAQTFRPLLHLRVENWMSFGISQWYLSHHHTLLRPLLQEASLSMLDTLISVSLPLVLVSILAIFSTISSHKTCKLSGRKRLVFIEHSLLTRHRPGCLYIHVLSVTTPLWDSSSYPCFTDQDNLSCSPKSQSKWVESQDFYPASRVYLSPLRQQECSHKLLWKKKGGHGCGSQLHHLVVPLLRWTHCLNFLGRNFLGGKTR